MKFCCVPRLLMLYSMLLHHTQQLMFPPAPGRTCNDNVDCRSGCCLQTGMRNRHATGVCQNLPQMGEYCAPGDRLRKFDQAKLYTYSCPCSSGLKCKPRWASYMHGRSVMEDPRCMPEYTHPYVLAMSGFGYNTHPPRHPFVTVVPAE